MKVLCAGGGSGGHVTPVLAVINELKQLDPSLEPVFVCDKAFEAQSRGIMAAANVPVPVYVIAAGKLRRYHGIPLWKQLLDIPTLLKNIRDVFFIFIGFLQSIILLRRERPDVMFIKGGYVCLPLGLAARMLRVPFVIHDSDTRPGLTNRVLSKYALRIATGSPLENYSYPASRSVFTGVPIRADFHPFTVPEQRRAKQTIGIVDLDKPLIVITGGGLGAMSINEGVTKIARELVDAGFSLYHVTGKKHYEAVKGRAYDHPDYHIVDFVYDDMATVLGAANIVISRGSATFLQELAALSKPTIVVPASHLGDQVKNAVVYENAQSVIVLSDTAVRDGAPLLRALLDLKSDARATNEMAQRFGAFSKPQAARDVALLVSEVYKETRGA